MREPIIFGKYLLTERIAVGGMAEIFRAKVFGVDGFEKPMVVKQILPQYARYKEFVDMFIDEAKITVSLGHGNIVPVYELGRIDGIYFIAMEYVDGRDLSQLMARARELDYPPNSEQSAFICIDMLKGLDYAHRRKDSRGRPMGIVHRDVSPQNIMVSFDGEVKILDFGIAKAARKLVETRPGAVKGKFGYLSPEQASGKPVDKRTDVFSVGVILWELLTLKRLYSGESDLDAIEKVSKAEVPAPSGERLGIPSAIDPIVLKAMAREPDDRYKDAGAFQLALSKFLYASQRSVTSESIAEYMKEIFKEELEEQKEEERKEQELVEKYREKMIASLTAAQPSRPRIRKPLGTQPGVGTARPVTDPGRKKRRTQTRSPLLPDRRRSDITDPGVLRRPSAPGGAKPRASSPSLSRPSASEREGSLPGTGASTSSTEKRFAHELQLADQMQKRDDILDSLPFEYEVFASKDELDELSLDERASRSFGGHVLWVATVLLLLGIMGYVVVTRTDLVAKITGQSARDRKKKVRQQLADRAASRQSYYGHISLRCTPPNATDKKGKKTWARFYILGGEGPFVLERVPLSGDTVKVMVEQTGLGQKTAVVPVEQFTPTETPASPGKPTHEASVTVDLENPPSNKQPEIRLPVPPGAQKPSGRWGRLEVKTRPEGARVWLYAGYSVDIVDTDPKKPMRFMVQLPGYRTNFVRIRGYRSRKDPGSWRPDPQGPQHVRYDKVIKLEPLPLEELDVTKKSKRRRKRRPRR